MVYYYKMFNIPFNCKYFLFINTFKSVIFPQEEKKLGEKRAVELTCLTGLFILRRTQEVINKYLPPKIENVVFCRPGALQIELYRKLLNSQAVRFCLQGLLGNSPHLICIGALKKLCNHPCLLFNSIKVSSVWDVSRIWAKRSVYLRGQIGPIPGVAFVGFPEALRPLLDVSSVQFIQSFIRWEHVHIHMDVDKWMWGTAF